MESTMIRLTIDPRRIAWLKFLLESYEGLALIRTRDPKAGKVALHVGVGAERETVELLRAVRDEIGMVDGLSDDLDGIRCGIHLDGQGNGHENC